MLSDPAHAPPEKGKGISDIRGGWFETFPHKENIVGLSIINVFREEAFRFAHNLPDDGSGRKVLIHSIIGGLISQFAGAGFASGAAGAGLNEALINNLKGLDPTLAHLISGAIGAAAAKIVNGDATAGAISATRGTKYNYNLTASNPITGRLS